MFSSKFIKILILFVLLLPLTTGCDVKKESMSDSISKRYSKYEDSGKQYEIVRLDNGMVIYKDKTNYQKPIDYRNVNLKHNPNNVQFGPGTIIFGVGETN